MEGTGGLGLLEEGDLRRGAGEVSEEGGDLGRAKFRRVAAVVEEDEAPHPIDVAPNEAGGVAAGVQRIGEPIEQPGRCGARWREHKEAPPSAENPLELNECTLIEGRTQEK